ncbi:hypothetical protein [Pseudomonas orientalis]|uniref:hypothetical protein n=1 Tax=Pseudomonas orientalis TaxID=76758 RepID=UPI003988959B
MARSLMKEAGIASRQRRPHKYKSSGVESLVAEHELEREFYVADINKVWCADITYIQLGNRWLYFSVVWTCLPPSGGVVVFTGRRCDVGY